MGEQAPDHIYAYYMEECIEAVSYSVSSFISNEANRDIAKRKTQGTINGVIKAMNEKIVDTAAERF